MVFRFITITVKISLMRVRCNFTTKYAIDQLRQLINMGKPIQRLGLYSGDSTLSIGPQKLIIRHFSQRLSSIHNRPHHATPRLRGYHADTRGVENCGCRQPGSSRDRVVRIGGITIIVRKIGVCINSLGRAPGTESFNQQPLQSPCPSLFCYVTVNRNGTPPTNSPGGSTCR